jgi:hypothetical protein
VDRRRTTRFAIDDYARPMDDYRAFLDKLAGLEGATISVYIGAERSGSAPVAVIRGVAGQLDMSHGWAGDDETSSIAFLPVSDSGGTGPFGPPGLLFNHDVYEQGGGDGNTLITTLGGVDLQIVRESG